MFSFVSDLADVSFFVILCMFHPELSGVSNKRIFENTERSRIWVSKDGPDENGSFERQGLHVLVLMIWF